MNTEDFVTYEQALALKELGFDLAVNHYYDDEKDLVESLAGYNNEDSYNSLETAYDDFNHGYCDEVSCSAPTLAQAQKWLLKNKGIYVNAIYDSITENNWLSSLDDINNSKNSSVIENKSFNSPEEALSDGITECLKFLENIEK